MSTPVPVDPEPEPSTTSVPTEAATHPTHNDHLDPITGEPHAHPVGVGVGAMGAGAVGAAIGAFAGPIGVVIGAAIGAIAGGLAGKEVAEEPEISPNADNGVPLDEFDHSPASTAQDELPLSPTLSERTEPADDAFFTGGTVSGRPPEPSGMAPLEPIQSYAAANPASTSTPAAFEDDEPLPTASSGLITPERSGFFADSTTSESSVLTESPFPAARAVDAKGTSELADDTTAFTRSSSGTIPADTETTLEPAGDSAAYAGHFDTEHTVRTSAYYRYLDREMTGEPGSEFDDWISAEKEILRS